MIGGPKWSDVSLRLLPQPSRPAYFRLYLSNQ